jgi:hypothetical protein
MTRDRSIPLGARPRPHPRDRRDPRLVKVSGSPQFLGKADPMFEYDPARGYSGTAAIESISTSESRFASLSKRSGRELAADYHRTNAESQMNELDDPVKRARENGGVHHTEDGYREAIEHRECRASDPRRIPPRDQRHRPQTQHQRDAQPDMQLRQRSRIPQPEGEPEEEGRSPESPKEYEKQLDRLHDALLSTAYSA